jgi:hypothetical protein
MSKWHGKMESSMVKFGEAEFMKEMADASFYNYLQPLEDAKREIKNISIMR